MTFTAHAYMACTYVRGHIMCRPPRVLHHGVSSTLIAHAHEGYCSHHVCVFVCVCYHSSAGVPHVCDKLNLLGRSSMNDKGFHFCKAKAAIFTH